MNSKELQNILKEAKEAIVNKYYDEAVKLCKDVLKEDRTNYMALVLLGAAMQETDQKEQAPKAFKKATELQAEHILAWQGLASYYEKYSTDSLTDYMFTVYKNLLKLESDTRKWCEVFKKFVNFSKDNKNINEYLQIVEEHRSTDIPEKKEVLWPSVVTILIEAENLEDDYIKWLSDALAITERNSSKASKILLDLLYKHRKFSNIFYCAKGTSDPYAKEVACKMLGELSVEEPNLVRFVETDIVGWCDNLLSENSANYSGIIGKAACLLKNTSYSEARDLLDSYSNQYSKSWHFQSMLSKTHLKLLCFYDAEMCAESAKKYCTNPIRVPIVDNLLIEALAHSNSIEKWNSCIEICKTLLSDDRNNPLALECMCRAFIKLENWDIAKKLLTKLEEVCSGDREVTAMLLRLQLAELADKVVPPLEILIGITAKHPNSPEAWYQLGMRCLQDDEVQQGVTALFKAAKLAPYWYKVYLELGNYFTTHDIEKARCCYKNCLYLNVRCSEAAMALSEIYRVQGEVQLNMELLTAVTKTEQNKWAWLQLGMLHFELEDVNAAVKCLLAAIRIDVEDSHCWELLGDAYLARRAYTAAEKSYQKVVQLKPEVVYPRLQIAQIKLITGDAECVVPEFRALATDHPQEVPILKGLAEACLQTAKCFHSQRLLGLARDYLQEALDTIAIALREWSDIACLWKLLGDVFIRAGNLPQSWAFLNIPSWFDPRQDQSQKTVLVNSQLALYNFATSCYSQALKLLDKTENCSALWHDLASSYCLQSRLNTDSRDKKQLMRKGFEAAKKSICLNPKGHGNWNLLGVIASSTELNQKPLAQHCYIQSILNEEKNAVAWTNLGVLYLELNQLPLANQAFKSAQRIDENYLQSWIGQALIAETTAYADTLDLFRHTTQLGFHPESGLGYAELVLQTMQEDLDQQQYMDNIVSMHAVSVASDAMTWYTEERENDSCGFNTLGCLQEKSGLFSCAVKSFQKALESAPKQHFNTIRSNLGRVYLRMNNYKEAIKVLREVNESDFQTQCNVGLAYFKVGMYKEALEHFDAVSHYYGLDDDKDSKQRCDILIAKAAILYKSAKSKRDFYDAKTCLLECIVPHGTSAHGLFASFAFGILKDDLDLSKSVLKELQPMQDKPECIFHISTFQAYFKFIQGDLKGSVKSLEKSVHRQPWHASLWFGLALLILEKICNTIENDERDSDSSQELKQFAKAAAHCAYTSMQIGRTSMDVTKVLPVVSVCHMLSGDFKRSLSVSQHAVHLFPNIAEGWATFVSPALHHEIPEYPVNIASSLLSFVRKNLHLERTLAKWTSNAEKRLEILAASSKTV